MRETAGGARVLESYLVTLGEDYAYFCENFAEFLQDPGEMTKSRLLFIFELIKDNNARHLTIAYTKHTEHNLTSLHCHSLISMIYVLFYKKNL